MRSGAKVFEMAVTSTSLERCPTNVSQARSYFNQHVRARGLLLNNAQEQREWQRIESRAWALSTIEPINTFACLNSEGRLNLPLRWGDPPARQVPLFIKWEDYKGTYLPDDLSDLRDVTFLQVGANCGKNTYNCAAGGDPIWSYATSCGWRGLAIEPVSYVFLNLCWNYARWASRVTSLRGAVSDRPGLATITLGGGETNKLMRKGEVKRPGRNESVPVVDLQALWDLWSTTQPSGRPIDILVIDAEGAEGQVLGVEATGEHHQRRHPSTSSASSYVPLPQPLPSLLLFEHAHLKRPVLSAIDTHLKAQGYTHITDLKNMDPRGRTMRPANRLYGRKRGA